MSATGYAPDRDQTDHDQIGIHDRLHLRHRDHDDSGILIAFIQRYGILGPGAPHVLLGLFLTLTNPWAVMLLGDLHALMAEQYGDALER
jgi:hypothetical protein